MRTPFTRFLQPAKWKKENWGKIDFTHFPDDIVDHEALPRGRFSLFSSSVYEDLINTRTSYLINHFMSKINVVGLAIIDCVEKNVTIKAELFNEREKEGNKWFLADYSSFL